MLGFNVDDIQGSIPQLLSGLKLAFTTSIAGMVSSILIKLFAVKDSETQGEATPETIQAELSRINETLEKNNNELRDEFKKLLSGDDDTSLVNQIKLLNKLINLSDEEILNISNEKQKTSIDNKIITKLIDFKKKY